MDQSSNFTFDNFIKYACIPLLAFAAGLYYSLYLDNFYQHLVRHFLSLFSSGKIQFLYPAKDLSIFSNYTFIIATGLLFAFTVLLAMIRFSKKFILRFIIACVVFILSTIISTLVDAKSTVITCTACPDGIVHLPTGSVNYNFHFILSAIFYAAALIILNMKRKSKS